MAKRRRSSKRRSASARTKPQPTRQTTAKAAAPRGAPRRERAQRAGPAPGDRASYLRAIPAAASVLAGLIALVAYATTLHPSLPTGDSGELISAAYVLGIAHPPGYPLYTLLGYVVTHLPFASPALELNVLSAVLDAAAVGVVSVLIYRLVTTGDRASSPRWWPGPVSAAVGALLLAFSTVFWSYSVVSEVFALNNLFAAVLLLLALEWSRRPDRRLLWLLSLVFGVALTNQQTIVLLVPALVVLLWSGFSKRKRARIARSPHSRVRPRDVAAAVALFAVGLLPYLYLPLAARADPPVNWGDPQTLGRFVDHVSRSDYGTLSLVVEGRTGSVGEQLDLLATSLVRGFVVAGIVLALLGLWWARRSRAEAAALVLAFLATGPLFVAYAKVYVPDELTKGVLERFYMLPSVPLAVLAGAGAWQVLLWAQRFERPALRPDLVAGVAAVALLSLPAASAVAHHGDADQSGNHVALNYARDLLGPLPQNALLLMRSDENWTSVSYAQNVDGFRRDVVALDVELLKLPSTVERIGRQDPEIVIPFESYDGGGNTSLADVVEANLRQRPVYYVGIMEEKDWTSGFDELRAGFARQLVADGTAPDAYALLRLHARRFASLHYPQRSFPSRSWEAVVARSYGGVAFDLGFALQAGGKANRALAERMYRTAIRLAPDLAAAYKNLGLVLRDSGGDSAEILTLWRRFLELRPNDADAAAIRAEVARLEAKP